jgi:hypothetical protein
MTWSVFTFTHSLPQVIPDDDLYPHEFLNCKCHPFVTDDKDDDEVLVHNSFDGRENFERKDRLPS